MSTRLRFFQRWPRNRVLVLAILGTVVSVSQSRAFLTARSRSNIGPARDHRSLAEKKRLAFVEESEASVFDSQRASAIAGLLLASSVAMLPASAEVPAPVNALMSDFDRYLLDTLGKQFSSLTAALSEAKATVDKDKKEIAVLEEAKVLLKGLEAQEEAASESTQGKSNIEVITPKAENKEALIEQEKAAKAIEKIAEDMEAKTTDAKEKALLATVEKQAKREEEAILQEEAEGTTQSKVKLDAQTSKEALAVLKEEEKVMAAIDKKESEIKQQEKKAEELVQAIENQLAKGVSK